MGAKKYEISTIAFWASLDPESCHNSTKRQGTGNFHPTFILQTNVDDCDGNNCANGASCEDGINEYICHCLEGYRGQFCEVRLLFIFLGLLTAAIYPEF